MFSWQYYSSFHLFCVKTIGIERLWFYLKCLCLKICPSLNITTTFKGGSDKMEEKAKHIFASAWRAFETKVNSFFKWISHHKCLWQKKKKKNQRNQRSGEQHNNQPLNRARSFTVPACTESASCCLTARRRVAGGFPKAASKSYCRCTVVVFDMNCGSAGGFCRALLLPRWLLIGLRGCKALLLTCSVLTVTSSHVLWVGSVTSSQ